MPRIRGRGASELVVMRVCAEALENRAAFWLCPPSCTPRPKMAAGLEMFWDSPFVSGIAFVPRQTPRPGSESAGVTGSIDVGGAELGWILYERGGSEPAAAEAPVLVYFHANAETAADAAHLAPVYFEAGCAAGAGGRMPSHSHVCLKQLRRCASRQCWRSTIAATAGARAGPASARSSPTCLWLQEQFRRSLRGGSLAAGPSWHTAGRSARRAPCTWCRLRRCALCFALACPARARSEQPAHGRRRRHTFSPVGGSRPRGLPN